MGFRLRLQAHVNKLGHHPTLDQTLAVQERRLRLEAVIESFSATGANFIREAEFSEDDPPPSTDPLSTNDETGDDQREPEYAALLLPSSLGTIWRRQPENSYLVSLEISLRLGQANDALRQIRLGLAEKSFCFRKTSTIPKNYERRTRARTELHSLDSSIRQCAKIYNNCRLALVRLGADEDVLSTYWPLIDSDLQVSKVVVDTRLASRKESSLPWFWTVDAQAETQQEGPMSECKFAHLHLF